MAGESGTFGNILGSIPFVGNIFQGILDSSVQKRNVDRTISANKEMAQYQYSKDLEMWNRANEYNSPSQQMQRLQQAGLNPNLVYGGGVSGAAGNTSTSIPKYQAPRLEYNYRSPLNLATSLNMYQDFQLRQAQIDNTKEILKQNKAKAMVAEKTVDDMIYKIIQDASAAGYKQTSANLKMLMDNIDAHIWQHYRDTQILNMQQDASRATQDVVMKKMENEMFNKLGVRNVGGLLGSGINAISKLIPFKIGGTVTKVLKRR